MDQEIPILLSIKFVTFTPTPALPPSRGRGKRKGLL
jgi:hypothetical protein